MFFGNRATTYAELESRALRVANAFIGEGLEPQTRIAILDKGSDTYFDILFGAAKSNIVLVPVNWRLSPAEITVILNDASTEILFVGEDFFSTAEEIHSELKSIRKIIALSGAHPAWEPYESWRDQHDEADPNLPIDGSDVVVQLYTSGTTGQPKGAQLTNDNFMSLLPNAARNWGNWSGVDVNLVSLPLFHIAGTGCGLIGFFAGAANVLVREVDCSEIMKLIGERRVTKIFWVPALILFMLKTPGIEQADLSSLDLIIYGASPMPLDLLRRAMSIFKCGFAQVYGMTETTGAITWLGPEEHVHGGLERARSCGRPMASVEIRIVDANGTALPAGEVGEIICRTPQNMKGYWKLPDASAATIRGDWLYTGDAGYLDEVGYLYIHDRVKDMIISGGENIYPAEVESCMFAHPGVADVAVIGVPDDQWGEAVKALVVRKVGAEVDAEELIKFARERIAHYKAPRSVEFVETLPRNASGKILKRELRKPYWRGRDRQVN